MNRVGASATVAMLLVPGVAHATAPKACTESFERAQVLQKQGMLLAARDQLRICSQPSCPHLIVVDCTQWLDEVRSSMPSVVPLAIDDAGANLVDVMVSIDGAPVVNALAGQAIDVDPGKHHFTFERESAAKQETDVLVAVGEKNKRVVVTLPGAAAAGAAAAKSTSPVRTIGLVVAGVGVAGLAVGGVFGLSAIAKQNDANCPGNNCGPNSNPGALREAASDGNLSTAFFITGGVLVAAGIVTWLVAPSARSAQSSWMRPTPIALANGGGVGLVGGW